MRLLVKIGGAQLSDPAGRHAFALSVAQAREEGHEIVIVHGGGDQIREWSERLGLDPRYSQGLRVTDGPTAEVVTAVLGGTVGRGLARDLGAVGVLAVSLTGADANLFDARPLEHDGLPLGYVGSVSAVRPPLIQLLLEQGVVPLIASIAPLGQGFDGPDEHLYNINADHAAGPLAGAFEAEALLFLTDVEGVRDGTGQHLDALDARTAADLRSRSVLAGGMLPKVEAALQAAQGSSLLVKIAPAASAGAILAALEEGCGTRITGDGAGEEPR